MGGRGGLIGGHQNAAKDFAHVDSALSTDMSAGEEGTVMQHPGTRHRYRAEQGVGHLCGPDDVDDFANRVPGDRHTDDPKYVALVNKRQQHGQAAPVLPKDVCAGVHILNLLHLQATKDMGVLLLENPPEAATHAHETWRPGRSEYLQQQIICQIAQSSRHLRTLALAASHCVSLNDVGGVLCTVYCVLCQLERDINFLSFFLHTFVYIPYR